MKINLSKIKSYMFITGIFFVCYAHTSAQKNPVENYIQQAGDYANIYAGKMETNYNSLIYENYPYYINADFTDASIVYRNNYYPNQKVRLDLFKEQLIILPPEKQFGIIARSEDVEKVYMYSKTFVWLIPLKESGLKAGFYIQLLNSEKMQLFGKEYFTVRDNLVTYSFDHSSRYYLLYNGRYYTVKNKGSFSKLFPKYKKQINQFVKNNNLEFNKNTDISLASLAGYCEELITSTNK